MKARYPSTLVKAPAWAAETDGSPYVRLPASMWAFFGACALLGLTTANPWLTAASIFVLPIFVTLLWREGETPVLLFAVGYQWLQVTAKVFHADVLGISVDAMSRTETATVSLAIYLGLLGLVVLALGMRLGMRKLKHVQSVKAKLEADTFSPHRAFVLYLLAAVLSEVIGEYAWAAGGLAQPLLALAGVKWIFFFVLGYVVLHRREHYLYFLLAIGIEFVGGIGFFSGFKTVLFVTLLVIFTVRYTIRFGTVMASTFILAALFIFGAAWTAIKPDFREFLNEGTGTQSVLVEQGEVFGKVGELVGQLSPEDVALSMGPLFERIAYVDYLALTLDYVPQYQPHEGGQVWMSSIQHVTTPRMFFPNKPRLSSDSELTMRYTGLYLASDDQSTSISIGYMGESYVDFGRIGMFFPIFVLGLFWGYLYYFFMSRATFKVLGYGFATTLLLNAYQFEMASIKLLGGVTIRFIMLALVLHFLGERIGVWLQGRSAPEARALRPAADRQAATT